MSDHPTCDQPVGGSVQVSIPPGWYSYITGLSRNTHNQMMRLRIAEGDIVNTEYLSADFGESNETMKTRREDYGSYSILPSTQRISLELTCFYSTNPKIRNNALGQPQYTSKALTVLQAETPHHLRSKFPDYVTFFVFVQDSADQVAAQNAPLFNDAVCAINMIKGTGRGHHGEPLDDIFGTEAGVGGDDDPTMLRGPSDGAEENDHPKGPLLDLLFLQDCTGSQGPYIKSAADSIVQICNTIASAQNLPRGALRVGLIAFRVADGEFLHKNFEFTTDISVVQHNLSTLVATCSGEGLDDFTGAFDAALDSAWRRESSKMVILISDAPSCCTGKPTNGGPGTFGKYPMILARRMADLGITLHFIACEPTLSAACKYAYEFYKALTTVTGGLLLPLVSADGLADYIIGSCLEVIETEAIVADYGKNIARRVLFNRESLEALTKEYYLKLTARGIAITSLHSEPVYVSYPEAIKNAEVYTAWVDTTAALPSTKVPGPLLLPKISRSSVSPAVSVIKGAITEQQTARVIKLSVMRHAEVVPKKNVARPSRQEPNGNSMIINIPAGWFGFISGLSRAKYNQLIKLVYADGRYTNTQLFTSDLDSIDNIMTLERTGEEYFVFAPSGDTTIQLETSFFWSTSNIKGQALAAPAFVSNKLKVVETSTPMHLCEEFPDYMTYIILSEDQLDSELPTANCKDAVAIINLIKSTPMVFDAAES